MSNFNQIGFSVDTEEDYNALCLSHSETASFEQETALGTYVCWQESADFGPELWIQAEGDSIIGMHPYFRGKSEVKIGAVDIIDQSKITPLDAPLFCWFNPEKGNPDSGETQCLVDMVRYFSFDKKLPSMQTLSISAFAQEMDIYESAEKYNELHKGFTEEDIDNDDFNIVDAMALESFFSVGLFTDEETDEVPEPIALFSATVLETQKMKNPSTGRAYTWALVRTLGGTFDVVVGKEIQGDKPIHVGSVIKGAFWMGADFKDA
ncbi:MAG: hypothetical protein GW903_05770 [Alphaproteobacteria bacterium]|nr:hypothetical protein [Alphaproteobacteria bacterium]NCQ88388.1 hypothetical protein [Alphaproteobacteria bacterium]NCT05930.1 hypothetical protein [Alphaproteobacteria bacterium]